MSTTNSARDTPVTRLKAPVRRVKKAYEQVAEQLRALILSGELSPGTRLPSEAALADEFGVSRPTIRQALLLLQAQRLVRTMKGARGGSYVTVPTVDHISEFLEASISILTESQTVSLEEFLELRSILEVPGARLAAQHRTEEDVRRLREAIPEDYRQFSNHEQFRFNKSFHSAVAEASGNTLLYVAAQPVFSVLQVAIARSTLGVAFTRHIHDDHLLILEAIEAGDSDAAEHQMRRHLEFLRPEYEKSWIYAVDGRAGRR